MEPIGLRNFLPPVRPVGSSTPWQPTRRLIRWICQCRQSVFLGRYLAVTQQFPQTSPPARSDYGMTYDSVHSQVVIFGGQGSTNGVLGDTWTWDGANWTQEFPKNTPPARFGGALAYDSGHGQSTRSRTWATAKILSGIFGLTRGLGMAPIGHRRSLRPALPPGTTTAWRMIPPSGRWSFSED